LRYHELNYRQDQHKSKQDKTSLSMIKQEQLLFKHNRSRLHLPVLVHFSFSQSSHEKFGRRFINGVNGKLWQNFILHFQIRFLYSFFLLALQGIDVEIHYAGSNHFCSPWERYLEWWDDKFLFFWLSSFNPCHSCLSFNLSDPLVIVFLRLISKPKSLICIV